MKTATILVLLLLAGVFVSACTSTTSQGQQAGTSSPGGVSQQQVSNQAATGNLSVDTTGSNPDYGTLDNTSVSDSIPQ